MRFRSEQERMKHPQARLIPLNAWSNFHSGELSSFQLTLMQTASSGLSNYLAGLDNVALQSLSKRKKKEYWLAMAYSHPDITDDLLMDFAGCLNLLDEHVFILTAIIGRSGLMERLIKLAPDKVQDMIAAYNYGAFFEAASNGHLPVMDRLIELAPDKVQDMIAAKDYMGSYGAFQQAASNGHLPVMERLIELAPDKVQAMVAAKDYMGSYAAFRLAAFNGHLPVMERLIELAPDKVQAMIAAKDLMGSYAAFQQAAFKGHLPVMERLIELAIDRVQAMIVAENYLAFQQAARNGHLLVMERLIELAPDKVQDMIAAKDCMGSYGVFRQAAENGHLPVMERLIELAPDKVQGMIAAYNYGAFFSAAFNEHLPVVNRLLTFPFMFAYAELHERECGEKYVHPFIDARLNALQEERSALTISNPHAVFDITEPEEAKLCFYILRNLIRRNEPELLDNIRFLIEIPSVKALLHTEVTPRQPNELLRLALSKSNQAAAEILLTVSAVHDLVEQHDFYRQEARGGLNLEALARDAESSMTALTSGEQKRLEAALKIYQPIIKERGVATLMTELRDLLISRYKLKPAWVKTKDGHVIELPESWDEWYKLSLTLSDDTREQALHAYAQNTHHTAWRYLQKPNPWIAVNAPYVNRNASEEGWSTFEDYQPLIAMFYLGASDKNIAPCDGHTLETRLEHFFDELAHIGRAHNWDETRTKTNDSGEPCVDEFGEVITEAYDDLKGDKPSCYSGVKRRLFQSVLGHPLLKMLTMDDIKQELREFVRGHFQQCIQTKPEDAIEWKTSWDTVCDTSSGGELLSAIDIPQKKQDAFIQALRHKYPSQFDEDPGFQTYIRNRFTLNTQVTTHAARFGGETDLTTLLKSCVHQEALGPKTSTATGLQSSTYAMFKSTQSTSRAEEENKEKSRDEDDDNDIGEGCLEFKW